jgi:hypothetical protein
MSEGLGGERSREVHSVDRGRKRKKLVERGGYPWSSSGVHGLRVASQKNPQDISLMKEEAAVCCIMNDGVFWVGGYAVQRGVIPIQSSRTLPPLRQLRNIRLMYSQSHLPTYRMEDP